MQDSLSNRVFASLKRGMLLEQRSAAASTSLMMATSVRAVVKIITSVLVGGLMMNRVVLPFHRSIRMSLINFGMRMKRLMVLISIDRIVVVMPPGANMWCWSATA